MHTFECAREAWVTERRPSACISLGFEKAVMTRCTHGDSFSRVNWCDPLVRRG